MAINMQKYCDNKAMSGYGSALLYKDVGETKYHLLLPLETVPAVNGSVDTFEFDLLNCTTKGKVEGKESLEEKDIEFLWHRDNVERLESLQGKVIDFLTVYPDMTGRKFSGTIKVRPNDATAEILRGTFSITPISASITTLLDCSDIIQDTVGFASVIPAKIVMKKTSSASATQTIACVTDPADATVTPLPANGAISAKYASGALTITATSTGTQIISITVAKAGMANWTTYMLVEVVDA